VKVVGKRRKPGLARRLGAEIGDLLALEQVGPLSGGGCHSLIEAATAGSALP
jgi:hypothetical protein